jgi:hypothetical protein
VPTRLLREGIVDSEAVNRLSWPAEVFYRRLMSVVDDFARFDARPAVLRSRLYPLKIDAVREADISRWIAECETAGLIALYACTRAGGARWITAGEKSGPDLSADERPYILFHKFDQQVRAKVSKFPAPPDLTCPCAADAQHVPGTCEADAPHMRSESESETKSNAESNPFAAPQGGGGSGEQQPPADDPAAAKKKKPRARDELFDAIAEVCAADPVVNGPHIGKIRSRLAKAAPPYTPGEVHEFGRRFWELCSWAAENGRGRPTLGELGNFISRLRAGPGPPQSPPPGRNGRPKSRGEADDEYWARCAADAFPQQKPGVTP